MEFQAYLQQLAEQHNPADLFAYMGAAMGGAMGGMRERYKQLLEGLKSGEEARMMQAVIDLSSELSMAQDSAISPHTLEQFVQPLVEALKKDAFPDIVRTLFALTSSLCHHLSHEHD